MSSILMLYSSTDGHTLAICRRLQQIWAQGGQQVTLVSITDTAQVDLALFDRFVIGASIRYGRHRPAVYDFIVKNRTTLESKPNAFFSVNLVARKPDKNRPETNPYLKKFLKQVAWRPTLTAVFAGKINYPKYGFWDRQIICLIMWLTGGPTDASTVMEYTDWQLVETFARLVCELE